VVQTRLTSPVATPAEGSLGIPVFQTQPLLQQDVFKELVNKFAWVLGSTYRQPYGNRKCLARQYAITLAGDVISSHGYPISISQ